MSIPKLTDPGRAVWRSAGERLNTLYAAHRAIEEHDRKLELAVRVYEEAPTLSDLHEQATATSDLITAAQAYRRDLLKLLALAGGYDKEVA